MAAEGGTFVSVTGGTFETAMPGTFETVLGGTIKPLPSTNESSLSGGDCSLYISAAIEQHHLHESIFRLLSKKKHFFPFKFGDCQKKPYLCGPKLKNIFFVCV